MGDGSKHQNGLHLNIQGFNCNEVVLLANILRIKFDLNPTLQKSKPDSSIYSKVKLFNEVKEKINYKIYINRKDLNKIKLRSTLLLYF